MQAKSIRPVGAAAYWALEPSEAFRALSESGQPPVWVDQVVAQVPCAARHTVVFDRLPPSLSAVEAWELGPAHGTARLSSDRQKVEVHVVGTVGLTFRDRDGETRHVRRSYQVRRDVLLDPVPPQRKVYAWVGASAGEGRLTSSGTSPIFRGTVHLTALLHLTEPTLQAGTGTAAAPLPRPLPLAVLPDDGAGVSPSRESAGHGTRSGGSEALDIGEKEGSFQRGVMTPWEKVRHVYTPPDEPGGTLAVCGTVDLVPGFSLIGLHTRSVDPEETRKPFLEPSFHVTCEAEDERGRQHAVSWRVSLASVGEGWDVVHHEWEPDGGDPPHGACARPTGRIHHTVWLRRSRTGPRSAPSLTVNGSAQRSGFTLETPRGALEEVRDETFAESPSAPAPAARSMARSITEDPAVSDPRVSIRPASSSPAPDSRMSSSLISPSPASTREPTIPVVLATPAVQTRSPSAPARLDPSATTVPPSAGPIVWRLPQPVFNPSSASQTRRPGASDGSR